MANIVGIDIGSYTVKATQVKEKAGKFVLQNFGVVDISEEPIESLEPAQRNVLVLDAVKKLLTETNIKTKDIGISLSGDQVVVRYVKLPFMTKEELKGVIRFEAEQYIPFNMDQVVLDFAVLGDVNEEGQKKIEVLLVAVKEEIVNQYIEMFKGLGLHIALIDSDCFALQNAYQVNFEKKENETIALLNIGAKYSNLNILEDGVTKFSRDIPLGGIAITRDIQRDFNVSFGEAEKLKKEHGSIIIESEEMVLTRIPTKEDKRVKIFSAITNTLSKLVMEVRRAFDFYEASSKKRAIGKVFLSGGGAKLKNMEKFINERLKVPVEYNNPVAGIEVENITVNEGRIKDLGIYLPVSIGLSVRRIK